jgi:hypothetical protein
MGDSFSAWPRALPFLFQEILHGCVVKYGVARKPLQSHVLILQRPQPLGLRDLQPAELGFPFVDAGVVNAMLAAQVGDRNAGLVLL